MTRAAETLAAWPQAIVQLDEQQLRTIPGIGKDLAARIRELAQTGASSYHRELLEQFPATILDLLRLQGVGPKTVAMLYSTLDIKSIDDLAAAAARAQVQGTGIRDRDVEHAVVKVVGGRVDEAVLDDGSPGHVWSSPTRLLVVMV